MGFVVKRWFSGVRGCCMRLGGFQGMAEFILSGWRTTVCDVGVYLLKGVCLLKVEIRFLSASNGFGTLYRDLS